MIAPRFASAVCVLIALALVPTLIHSYAGVVVNDGRRASTLSPSLAGFMSRPSDRDETWGRRRFESDDWTERVFATDDGNVTLSVIRSHDLKALYHHPELAVAYGTSLPEVRVVTIPEYPDVPVHVLEGGHDVGPAVFYVLHYDDRFVDDPIWFQLRTAGELLFTGRRAMTLFFALDPSLGAGADLSARPAMAILFAAIRELAAAGPSGS